MHSHHHHHHAPQTGTKGLTMAFWLNLIFSIIEAIGGVLTNSTAILADAFHDFMDAISIGAAVILERISGKKRSARFSYGYRRFSLLSAVGLSVFLLIGAAVMIFSAIQSLRNPQVVDGAGMFWLAILGVAVNGAAFLRLRRGNADQGHQHAHGHGHSHSHSGNRNTKAVALHLLEDVLGWIAVMVGAVIIYYTGWFWVDGVLAIGIAIFIGYNAGKNLLGTMEILLQSVPAEVDMQQLVKDLARIKGVKDIHDLHVWSLDGSYHVASFHVVINKKDEVTASEIKEKLMEKLQEYDIQHPTIQLESERYHCEFKAC